MQASITLTQLRELVKNLKEDQIIRVIFPGPDEGEGGHKDGAEKLRLEGSIDPP